MDLPVFHVLCSLILLFSLALSAAFAAPRPAEQYIHFALAQCDRTEADLARIIAMCRDFSAG